MAKVTMKQLADQFGVEYNDQTQAFVKAVFEQFLDIPRMHIVSTSMSDYDEMSEYDRAQEDMAATICGQMIMKYNELKWGSK